MCFQPALPSTFISARFSVSFSQAFCSHTTSSDHPFLIIPNKFPALSLHCTIAVRVMFQNMYHITPHPGFRPPLLSYHIQNKIPDFLNLKAWKPHTIKTLQCLGGKFKWILTTTPTLASLLAALHLIPAYLLLLIKPPTLLQPQGTWFSLSVEDLLWVLYNIAPFLSSESQLWWLFFREAFPDHPV